MPKNKGWFRIYDRMIDSPQVLELNDSEFRLLVSLWCLASSENNNGLISHSEAAIRRRLLPEKPLEEIRQMLDHLKELDLLAGDKGAYRIQRWNVHQYEYSSKIPGNRTDLKKNQREINGKSTGSEWEVNGNKREINGQVDPETETDPDPETEIKIKKENVVVVAGSRSLTDLSNTMPDGEAVSPSLPTTTDQATKATTTTDFFSLLEKETGKRMTAYQKTEVSQLLTNYTPELIQEAIRRAALRGKPGSLSYIKAILQDWSAAGLGSLPAVLAVDPEKKTTKGRDSPEEAVRTEGQPVRTDPEREKWVEAACTYIRLTLGENPEKEKAKKIADGYGQDVASDVMMILFGGDEDAGNQECS